MIFRYLGKLLSDYWLCHQTLLPFIYIVLADVCPTSDVAITWMVRFSFERKQKLQCHSQTPFKLADDHSESAKWYILHAIGRLLLIMMICTSSVVMLSTLIAYYKTWSSSIIHSNIMLLNSQLGIKYLIEMAYSSHPTT